MKRARKKPRTMKRKMKGVEVIVEKAGNEDEAIAEVVVEGKVVAEAHAIEIVVENPVEALGIDEAEAQAEIEIGEVVGVGVEVEEVEVEVEGEVEVEVGEVKAGVEVEGARAKAGAKAVKAVGDLS